MPEYQYRIVTPQGKEKKGTIVAKSTELATIQLKSEQNIVLSIQEANILNRDINITIGALVKPRDLSIFCRQFVSIIKAGVTVVEALEMMAEQTENRNLGKAIANVKEEVSKGDSLAGAMKKFPKIFPPMLCNMVEAGEASGSLEIAFERMATQFEKDTRLRESVKKAMIYPIMVIFVMIGVLVAMMLFVIPNFMSMFADMDMEMPVITQLVINMSDFMLAKWWLIIIVVVVAYFALKCYKSTESGKYVIGGLKLKIPVFGKLQTKSSCARLGRTLCTLLGAGVPMIEALEITSKNMDNVHYKRALMDAREQVSRGVTLSRPLKDSGLFPPMVVHMVGIGEETGNIEEMLENIATYYEEDVEVTTQQLTALMEPMIIIVMAVMVGFLVIAIMQPMLTMYQGLDAL